MKKRTGILLYIVIVIFTFCSCGKEVAGEELINAAREAYASLDSAKVVITNTDTDKTEQTFTFMYDEKDVLIFAYEGEYNGKSYLQYNNGFESFTMDNGEYSYCERGDSDFQSYNRDVTHPQAGEGLVLFQKNAVKNAEITEKDGITTVRHVYDVSKIDTSTEEGEITGFNVTYEFDSDGNLLDFFEVTDVDNNGEKSVHSYKIEITEKNQVKTIDNPVEIPKEDEE